MRVATVLAVCGSLVYFPLATSAASAVPLVLVNPPSVFITEVQTNHTSASEEFIEIYNSGGFDSNTAGNDSTEIGSWKVQFFSATSVSSGIPDWTKPSTSITLSEVLKAENYYILGATGYNPGGVEPEQSFSSRLSDTGGGIQLVKVLGNVVEVYDRIMWKKASVTDNLPKGVLPAPPAAGSLQRVPNSDAEYTQGEFVADDFVVAESISPGGVWIEPEIPEIPEITIEDDVPDGEEVIEDTEDGADNTGLIAPVISEMLPNPMAPQTDATDEFVELYNPNTDSFSLTGYSLQVGLNASKKYTFQDEIMTAGEYRAFKVTTTRLSLTNSGSHVKLLDADTQVIASADPYMDAKDGQAWALYDGMWQWTTTPTPGSINNLTLPAPAPKAATASKSAVVKTPKKTTSKVKSAAAVKKVKAKKPTAKKKQKAPKAVAVASIKEEPPQTPIHKNILVGVAIAAVLYGLYEYRHDIANKFRQLRQHRESSRAHGRQSAWR